MPPTADKIIIQGLQCRCIIGDYVWERKRPQKIILDLEMETDLKKAAQKDILSKEMLDYNQVAKEVLKFVEQSSFHLIETLAEKIAALVLKKFPIKTLRLRLKKPSAIQVAEAAMIEIVRVKK